MTVKEFDREADKMRANLLYISQLYGNSFFKDESEFVWKVRGIAWDLYSMSAELCRELEKQEEVADVVQESGTQASTA